MEVSDLRFFLLHPSSFILHPFSLSPFSSADESRHHRSPRLHFQPRPGLRLPGRGVAALQPRDRPALPRRDGPPRRSPPRKWCARPSALFWDRAGPNRFPFSCEIAGDVPMSRGLGSSVTLRLGVLTGLNALAGRPLARQELFEICSSWKAIPTTPRRRSSAASRWRAAARRGTGSCVSRCRRRCTSCCWCRTSRSVRTTPGGCCPRRFPVAPPSPAARGHAGSRRRLPRAVTRRCATPSRTGLSTSRTGCR